jgi:uncharacterized protein YwqG
MESISQLLAMRGLTRIAEQVAASAKPSLLLAVEANSTEPCSRLGGHPNLPDEVSWPAWQGQPLPFVAQLDLATLNQGHGLSLPTAGGLYFFYEGGKRAWGFKPDDKGSAQVIYSPTPLQDHAPRPIPDQIPPEMRFTSVRLDSGSSEITLPDPQDQFIESLGLSPEERENYWEFLDEWEEQKAEVRHRLGGYPEPIQGDPKLEAHLVSHGLYCGNATGYKQGKDLGLWPGAVDWELLLQVDSDESAGMMWGDVGRIYFLIHSRDLRAHAFHMAQLVFQCH